MATTPVFGTLLPIIAAPMAGGPTTVALADAVTAAGGFAFLAGGYRQPEELAGDIGELRRTQESFGVNLFVPGPERMDPRALASYAEELRPEFAAHRLVPDATPIHDDDHWGDKLALLRESPVAVVSFTFGLPTRAEIAGLKRVGSMLAATVTTPAEAAQAEEAGLDVLIVQGPAAGGHSAAFLADRSDAPRSTADLLRAVAARTKRPLVATGGIDGAEAVRELLAAGGDAVAVGTLLLRADESGTTRAHREALADPRFTRTVLTRTFTGRRARALRNGFIDRHQDTAPVGYPEVHHLTRPLRAAAARAGDTDRMHLWAGTGFRSALTGPVAGIVVDLTAGL